MLRAGLDTVQGGCLSDPVGIVSRDPSRGDAVNRTALAPISAGLLVGGLGAEMPAHAEVAASELMVVTAAIQQVAGRGPAGGHGDGPPGSAESVAIHTVRALLAAPRHL